MTKILIILWLIYIPVAFSYPIDSLFTSGEFDQWMKINQAILKELYNYPIPDVNQETLAKKLNIAFPPVKPTKSVVALNKEITAQTEKELIKNNKRNIVDEAAKVFPLCGADENVSFCDLRGRQYKGKMTENSDRYIKIGFSVVLKNDIPSKELSKIDPVENKKNRDRYILIENTKINNETDRQTENLSKDIAHEIMTQNNYLYEQELKKWISHAQLIEYETKKIIQDDRTVTRKRVAQKEYKLTKFMVFNNSEWMPETLANTIAFYSRHELVCEKLLDKLEIDWRRASEELDMVKKNTSFAFEKRNELILESNKWRRKMRTYSSQILAQDNGRSALIETQNNESQAYYDGNGNYVTSNSTVPRYVVVNNRHEEARTRVNTIMRDLNDKNDELYVTLNQIMSDVEDMKEYAFISHEYVRKLLVYCHYNNAVERDNWAPNAIPPTAPLAPAWLEAMLKP